MNNTFHFLVRSFALALVLCGLTACKRSPEIHVANPDPRHYHYGMLGGVPVQIPKKDALFFKCNERKGFFDRPSSEISGFAMATSIGELMGDYYEDKDVPQKFLDAEVRILVYAGDEYGVGQLFLERKANYCRIDKLAPGKGVLTPMPDDFHGMKWCAGVIYPYMKHEIMPSDNHYYALDPSEKVSTFMECSVSRYETVTCKQWFVLEPAMKVLLKVSYNRFFAKDWRLVQDKVSEIFHDFRIQ